MSTQIILYEPEEVISIASIWLTDAVKPLWEWLLTKKCYTYQDIGTNREHLFSFDADEYYEMPPEIERVWGLVKDAVAKDSPTHNYIRFIYQ